VNAAASTDPTPFVTRNVEHQPGQCTNFAALSPQVSGVWECERGLGVPIFRETTWDVGITDFSQQLHAIFGQPQSSISTLTASLPEDALPQWHFWKPRFAGATASAPEEDRRLYALAAVSRVQRLLRLTQDSVAELIHVSRPTLWNWQQGRTPQERSLRRLSDVTGVLDLVVDAMGGEEQFDPVVAQKQLQLDLPLVEFLHINEGPTYILDRLFEQVRASASLPSLLPTVEDLAEDDGLGENPLGPAEAPTRDRELRTVTRRDR
jgi:transcriptional regulator with XRE-family HTH domain